MLEGSISTSSPEIGAQVGGSLQYGIQGPAGPAGADGTVAFENLTAEQRESLRGPQGETGPQGAQGPQGEAGMTAYDYALLGGYSGSEEDFKKKLSTEHLSIAGGTMEGSINMNGQKLSGLNAPTEDDEAATKGYVDGKEVDLLSIYPVGSIYLSVASTSPASLFGGTWEQLKDTFLLGAGDTYTAGATGGEPTHTLTISEMPMHNHPSGTSNRTGSFGLSVSTDEGVAQAYGTTWGNVSSRTDLNLSVASQGDSGAHNNMPPYLTVYMWKRVA